MRRGDNNRKLTDVQRAEVVRMYTVPNGNVWIGVRTIARRFGVWPNAIDNILIKAGVVRRSRSFAIAHCGHPRRIVRGNAPNCACGCGKTTAWSSSRSRWRHSIKGHRKRLRCQDRSWLFDQYVNKKLTLKTIAAVCGVSKTTVKRYMRAFGIATRDAHESHVGTQRGAQNPAWQGGVTPERQRVYNTEEFKAVLRAVYRRDQYRCCRCDSAKKGVRGLHAHHIFSWAKYPKLRYQLTNLVTLCRTCHEWVHSRQNVHGVFLARVG